MLFAEKADDFSLEATLALAEGRAENPANRATLETLFDSLSAVWGEPPVVVAPPARFWTEDQLVKFRGRDYRIVSRLGSGGVGTTFKVVRIDENTGEDVGAYVAKVILDKGTGQRVLRAYNLAHSHLADSAALSTIFETAAEWRDNEFISLMRWIEGEPLSELAGVLPILAEGLSRRVWGSTGFALADDCMRCVGRFAPQRSGAWRCKPTQPYCRRWGYLSDGLRLCIQNRQAR